MDPQGNTTSGLGLEKNELDKTTYEVITGEEKIQNCIVKDLFDNLSLLPANRNLAGAEIELMTVDKMQFIMKHNLEKVKKQYDFIIIDCPPALGMLTVNAMTAANTVIVPIQCEFYALDGLTQLIYTIELIQKSLNPDLTIEGVVFTMYDARTNLSLQVVENVKSYLNQNIYKTIIPRNVRLAEAPSHGLQSICMTLVLQEQKVTTFWQKKLSKMEVKINVSKKNGTWKRFKYADSKSTNR